MKSKSKLCLKAVSALTAGTLMMSLTACSGLTEKVEKLAEDVAVPGSITAYAEGASVPVVDKKSRGWVSKYGNLRLDMPQTHLDPEQVYKTVEYTADYFLGDYYVEDLYRDGEFQYKGDLTKKFFGAHKSIDIEYFGNTKINYLPVSIEHSETYTSLKFCSGDDDNYARSIRGELEVKDNQLVFTPDDSYKVNEPLAYDFSFKGTKIILSHDGESVELNARSFIEGEHYNSISVYAKADGKMLDNIEEIDISKYSSSSKYRDQYCQIKVKGNKDTIRNVAAYLGDDGRFNFSWTDEDGTIHAYEMVYFYLKRGLILTDGTNTYFYTKR